MASLWHTLLRSAERDPDRLLFSWLNQAGDVVDETRNAAFVLRTGHIAARILEEAPLPTGARVLLVYPPGIEMIAAFFACVRIGLVPVPVYPPTHAGFDAALHKMDFIAADCGAELVLTDRAYAWSIQLQLARHRIQALVRPGARVVKLRWLSTTDAAGRREVAVQERHSTLLFLQYTSGSTSSPKGVMVTHDNLIANADAVVDHVPVGVSWLPQYHDMGLIGYYLFFAIKGGTTYGFSPLDFIRRPALWLQSISRFRGTASSAPNFAFEYCLRPGKLSEDEVRGLDLSSLRFLMNAAEPVRASVMRAFLARFAPQGLAPRSFFAAYGLAESTLAVCNYGQRTIRVERDALHAHEARRATATTTATTTPTVELVSCGPPLPGTTVAIVDVDQHPPRRLGDGRVGEVWVRGPSVCAGYFSATRARRDGCTDPAHPLACGCARSAQSDDIFGAALDGERYLRTGDLGFVDGGELFLCGRRKDLIIARGQNLYPQDIERALEEHPAVRKGGVAAFGVDVNGADGIGGSEGSIEGETGEQVVAAVELRTAEQRPDPRELQALVQRQVGCGVDVLLLLGPRTLPKTSSGKLRRSETRALHLAGRLRVLTEHRGASPLSSPATSSPSSSSSSSSTPSSSSQDDDAVVFDLLGRHGVLGHEPQPLPELGLDSVQLVELSHALQEHLKATGAADVVDVVDVPVLQRIAVAELVAAWRTLRDPSPLARVRFRQALLQMGAEHRAHERLLLQRDCALNFDPADLPRATSTPSRSTSSSSLFLTGATGFLGPFLLLSLLEQTTSSVRVLVRARDPADARARVRAGLAVALGPGRLDELERLTARVTPVLGDLARVNLGLSLRDWQEVAEETTEIFHNGAMVHYLFDYEAMRDANVLGTNEILRLAFSHGPKILNHISTTFVFGWSTQETLWESASCDRLELLDFGYSQTKWVSEALVFAARAAGLRTRVFRPALLTPSVEGRGSHFDIAVRLLAFMIQHGLTTTALNQVSFSPVDVAAHNVVAIARQPDSLHQTFHVTRDQHATLADVTTLVTALTGRTFEALPLSAFVDAVVERCRPGDILFPLLGFLVRSTANITAMEFKRYDNTNFRTARARSPDGIADPPLVDVVQGLLRFMREKGLIDA